MLNVMDNLLKFKDYIQEEIELFSDDYDSLTTEDDRVRSEAILKDLTLFFQFQTQFFELAPAKDPGLSSYMSQLNSLHEEIQDVIDGLVMLHVDEPDREFITRMQKIDALMKQYNAADYEKVVREIGDKMSEDEQSAFMSKLALEGIVIPEGVFHSAAAV